MSRALIVGPRDALARSVDALYALQLLHIVDHQQGEADLEIGKPLPAAAEASEVLVKLRSIANILQVQEPKATATGAPPAAPGEDLKAKILALELNISEEDASKKKIQGLVADLSRRVDEITPFAQLPLALDDYRGYDSLEVLVGKAPRDITGFETVTPEYETFSVPGFLVVFVTKEHAARMREFLAQNGFTSIAVPEGDDAPRDVLANLLAERERWEKRLGEIEETLKTLRERYADFLVAARAHLEVQVEKAEAPLRFAVTDHTFIVEGWIPQESFPKAKQDLEAIDGVFVSEVETTPVAEEEPSEHKEEPEPPVLLRNPKPIRPFEMLVNMFGTPSYHEIDPTIVLSIAFPMMFGIMVGDAGYGLLWMAYGVWLLRRWKDRPWDFWKNLLVAFIWGGFWATVFGTFVFAEAFGVPFHVPVSATTAATMFNWSDNILHLNIPIHPILEKLDQVTDFIIMAISVAAIHLGIAFIIGFFDDIRHSVKHAVGKVAWLMVLVGLYVVMIVRAARWSLIHGGVPWGYAIWNGPLAWFPRAGIPLASGGFGDTNQIPYLALGLIVAGILIVIATEGALHLMEVFGLMANVISYARLAGIGVAEEAVIVALNSIVLSALVINGSVVTILIGVVMMGLCNFLIFLLSTISGTIQSIRLNYVEFFVKFYKGSGTLFRPFGVKAKSEV